MASSKPLESAAERGISKGPQYRRDRLPWNLQAYRLRHCRHGSRCSPAQQPLTCACYRHRFRYGRTHNRRFFALPLPQSAQKVPRQPEQRCNRAPQAFQHLMRGGWMAQEAQTEGRGGQEKTLVRQDRIKEDGIMTLIPTGGCVEISKGGTWLQHRTREAEHHILNHRWPPDGRRR